VGAEDEGFLANFVEDGVVVGAGGFLGQIPLPRVSNVLVQDLNIPSGRQLMPLCLGCHGKRD
jgi:hypothetical protein